jgi:L-2,4-diaminobutyrate decarboxylase
MDVRELRAASHAAIDELASYVERTAGGDGPAVGRASRAAVAERLDLARLLRDGGLDAASFGDWLSRYLREGVHLHHPREMCHQVAVPDVGGALADLVHGVTNQPMSIYEMGPAAAAIELAVVEWMVGRVGWQPGVAGGVLTHGGSLANLTALLAARARAAPDAWRDGVPHDLAILAPPSAHYSVARAAGILGLGEAAVVALDVDELDRVRADRVQDALLRTRAAGRRPMAVVATAGATGTGLYDDLRAIGEVCREQGVWLHVDGAHGASALLSARHRHRLDGIELADSVIWDAHKMLRTSSLCAAVLVRDAHDLPAAFRQHASYLDFDNPDGVDVIDRQIECTKGELGLKLFLGLAFAGEAGLAGYVDEQYAKALTLWRLVRSRPGFSAPYRPQSNILCFRYGGPGVDQAAIRDALLADGDFHISSAEVAGRRHLRVAIMSPATDAASLAALLDAVEAAGTTLERAAA